VKALSARGGGKREEEEKKEKKKKRRRRRRLGTHRAQGAGPHLPTISRLQVEVVGGVVVLVHSDLGPMDAALYYASQRRGSQDISLHVFAQPRAGGKG
jgi:hypothetical protein